MLLFIDQRQRMQGIRSEAVDKLDADAQQILSQVSPSGGALYQDAFLHLAGFFSAIPP